MEPPAAGPRRTADRSTSGQEEHRADRPRTHRPRDPPPDCRGPARHRLRKSEDRHQQQTPEAAHRDEQRRCGPDGCRRDRARHGRRARPPAGLVRGLRPRRHACPTSPRTRRSTSGRQPSQASRTSRSWPPPSASAAPRNGTPTAGTSRPRPASCGCATTRASSGRTAGPTSPRARRSRSTSTTLVTPSYRVRLRTVAPAPGTPANGPDEATTKAAAASLLTALGITGNEQFSPGAPASYLNVSPKVAGLPTQGMETNINVDAKGITSATGQLQAPTAGDDYPLQTAKAAFDSLASRPQPAIARYCGPMPSGPNRFGGVAPSAGSTRPRPRSASHHPPSRRMRLHRRLP